MWLCQLAQGMGPSSARLTITGVASACRPVLKKDLSNNLSWAVHDTLAQAPEDAVDHPCNEIILLALGHHFDYHDPQVLL